MKAGKKTRKAALAASISVPILFVLCLLTFEAGSARAEFGWADPENHNLAVTAAPDVLGDIQPSFHFKNARYATGGVALRNQQKGTITLSGIPPGSTILSAQLYWAWASLKTPCTKHNSIIFSRPIYSWPSPFFTYFSSVMYGTQVGTGADPCWKGDYNFVYRADVTKQVTGSGVYGVSLVLGSAGSVDGSDPWVTVVPPLAEGAALVVVYSNSKEQMGEVNIYDRGLAGNTFASAGLSYDLVGLPDGGILSLWDTIGADGQVGHGRLAYASIAQTTTTIDGNLIAGPGSDYNDSDWNGSSGKPLPQLWDVHGHEVDLNIRGGSVNVTFSSTLDCLVPVANVTLAFPPD